MQKEDLEVRSGPVAGTLLVKAHGKPREGDGTLLRQERGVGDRVRYERLVPVAWDADIAKAEPSLENGVLTVSIPKRSEKGPEHRPETQ